MDECLKVKSTGLGSNMVLLKVTLTEIKAGLNSPERPCEALHRFSTENVPWFGLQTLKAQLGYP